MNKEENKRSFKILGETIYRETPRQKQNILFVPSSDQADLYHWLSDWIELMFIGGLLGYILSLVLG